MTLMAEIFSSRVRAEILRLLFGPLDREMHLREIERRSGLTVATVRQDIEKLARLDLVEARRDGNRLYYRANKKHPLYPDLRSLVLKTSGLLDVLRRALEGREVRSAFVFGSLARGEENAESDVDLLVIGNMGLRALTGRLAGASEAIGREINPHVITEKEFRERKRAGDHFLTTVLNSERLFIIGDEDGLAAMG